MNTTLYPLQDCKFITNYAACLNVEEYTICAYQFFNEKLSVRKWGGVILGLTGIIVITTLGKINSAGCVITGVIACLVATLFLMLFFAFSISEGPKINWSQSDIWITVITLGVICTALAYILYFQLIADIGPLHSLTVTFLIPPSAVLWGYLMLDEIIAEGFIIGAVIVCIAIWIAPNKVTHEKYEAIK